MTGLFGHRFESGRLHKLLVTCNISSVARFFCAWILAYVFIIITYGIAKF